ncbi:hypothetical protein A2291_03500 [candidate division WOR-1 bacterium RIFOXYB2_FULL_42_35]|uniref:Uncharacterized protein n=1 Tax=candidate division WOR-1 bacterium RIFOXYC2_FULL_41_25 TaxID=1802586 RepID=A0A1F4TQI2_UNCSA|nr:MAG: hypothetical protein A2247_03070 [candidate division WOR-1 bacterium RIFOXYA2_FULL_41_14]OGC25529.1 MAG: hypothetical protein A2291_03500 [candidate division WOR-1 bacterium RIFOXYB2_FULL_42_35]OGC34961.1 MAG: hypothetical protein A2462_05130 [candidate division WOR-1 bacterium RIFOXYC2_FULL_41_25]OGC41526.1 MAG: hypothetical protein A2548_01455 [candidate division WOR-1 bacterium RIFOXYD2_FULL_41_8]
MTNKPFIVRIVSPTEEPALPKADIPAIKPVKNKNDIFGKQSRIISGSTLGFAAGLIVYMMLKLNGVDLGRVESSFIIGMPSFLGVMTSLVMF